VIIVHWIAFTLTLAVLGLCWGLYGLQPNLLLGTPWGAVHVVFLIAAAFGAGLLVVGLYGLANWVRYQDLLRNSGRELKQVRAEVAQLKKSIFLETPTIPDRDIGYQETARKEKG
jgi:type VI protein secretion system component VasK